MQEATPPPIPSLSAAVSTVRTPDERITGNGDYHKTRYSSLSFSPPFIFVFFSCQSRISIPSAKYSKGATALDLVCRFIPGNKWGKCMHAVRIFFSIAYRAVFTHCALWRASKASLFCDRKPTCAFALPWDVFLGKQDEERFRQFGLSRSSILAGQPVETILKGQKEQKCKRRNTETENVNRATGKKLKNN